MSDKPKHSNLIRPAVFGAALAGGFLLAKHFPLPQQSPGKDEASVRAARPPKQAPAPKFNGAEITAAAEIPNKFQRTRTIYQLAGGATTTELRNLLERHADSVDIRSLIAKRWAEADPKGLYDYLNERLNRDVHDWISVEEVLFETWARQDPVAAYEASMQSWRTDYHLGVLLGPVFYQDADLAFDMIARAAHVNLGFGGNSGRWIYENPGKACAKVAGLPGCSFKELGLPSIAAAWAKEDPTAAAAWISGAAWDVKKQALPKMAGVIAETDPEFAAELVLKHGGGVSRTKGVGAVTKAWAVSDPEGAMRWIESNLAGLDAEESVSELVRGWGKNDPETAAEFVGAMSFGKARAAAVSGFSRDWAKKDAMAAFTWLRQLPEGEQTDFDTAISNVASAWASQDLDGMAAYVKDANDAEDATRILPLASSVAERLHETLGVEAAMEWISELEGKTAARATHRVMDSWSHRFPKEASEYANKMKPGEIRNAAVRSVATQYLRAKPDEAFDWLMQLPDATIKKEFAPQIERSGLSADKKAQFGVELSSD
jgi:hypothetical protein